MRAEMSADRAGHDRETADRLVPSAGSPPRFGFTATKKLGNAVARNRIRRRLKEVVRLVAPSQARAGCDYVLIAREAAATRLFATLERDLAAAFAALHAPGAPASSPARGSVRTPSTRGRARSPRPASES